MRKTFLFSAVIFFGSLCEMPLRAELPNGARMMIEAAIATGDKAKVATVIDLTRATWPEDAAEIDIFAMQWQATLAERQALAEAEEEQALRSAGLFDLWSGEGELGGLHSSGNTDSVGVTASLKLKREGINWTHLLRARADYQRQNGTTSREQFLGAYEPRWQFDEDVFAYGLAQYERDRIQGFSGRYAISGGLGYKVVDRADLSVSLKAGPAYRITEYTDGRTESRIAGLVGLDFDWQVFDRLKLTQDANALAETGGEAVLIVDGANTSLTFLSGLDFQVTDRLRSRLSYQLDYNSNPPANAVSTDTLTRATIVYGF